MIENELCNVIFVSTIWIIRWSFYHRPPAKPPIDVLFVPHVLAHFILRRFPLTPNIRTVLTLISILVSLRVRYLHIHQISAMKIVYL